MPRQQAQRRVRLALRERSQDPLVLGEDLGRHLTVGILEDLRIAADMLRGQKVNPGVRLIVTPASQAVYTEAIKRGYVETLAESGAIVTNSTCGACFGYHMGLLGAGEVCLTASTRNFKGRMGSPDAEIYMASPYAVAAAAIAGHIVDPRKMTV